MIKDNEDHIGLLVRLKNRTFFVFDTEEEGESVFNRMRVKPKDIECGSACIYNWNRGQPTIKLRNFTITLLDMEDNVTEKISRSIVVTREDNEMGPNYSP